MGLGSILMNRLKSCILETFPEKKSIVTYADNRALKFFEKNMFNNVPKNRTVRYKKYIEPYVEASLMEFRIQRKRANKKVESDKASSDFYSLELGLSTCSHNSDEDSDQNVPEFWRLCQNKDPNAVQEKILRFRDHKSNLKTKKGKITIYEN